MGIYGTISYDPADEERFYVSPPADPGKLIAHWACCGGRCDDAHTLTCPVLAPAEPYITAMLEGIERELAQWQPWEHRCFSRLTFDDNSIVQCACGKWPFLFRGDVDADIEAQWRMHFRRVWPLGRGGSHWESRPGTTLEVRRP